MTPHPQRGRLLAFGWGIAIAGAVGVRAWNALAGPRLTGYDAWGHLAYVFFLDLYGGLPWPDQGWSTFHPPLHYALGWALAQLGSSELLLRGLSLVGSAASLGIAALAARVARAAAPESAPAGLVAFGAVAFLPVHIYVSPMIGNELSAAFLAALGLALLIANEGRPEPRLAGDALAGLALGLALLAKFSAVGMLAAALLAVGLRGRPWRRAAARAAVLAGVALLLAGPFYARSAREYGTPLRMGRDNPAERRIEQDQPPGLRGLWDFVAVSPRLFSDPDPLAPHLLHSVWGSAYVHAWADARAARPHDSDAVAYESLRQLRVSRYLRERLRRVRSAMMWIGIGPTLLALGGAVLALGDVRRGRRTAVHVPLLVCAVATLGVFVAFSLRVPTFAAVKASYLLGLSLPYGAFAARGFEALAVRGPRPAAALAALWLALAAAAAAAVNASGAVLLAQGDSHLLGTARLHFGEHAAARRFFEARLAEGADADAWSENLATLELADGDLARARELYAQQLEAPDATAARWNGLAVATALSGEVAAALPLLDEAIARGAGAPAHVNRGALRALRGDLAGGERELRRALELEPELVVGWHDLAQVLARAGRADEARAADERARREAQHPPRGQPYGIGENLGHRPGLRIGRLWMLWLDGERLRLARADGRGPRS